VNPPTGLGLGVQTAGNIFSLYSLFFTIGALLSGFIGKYIFKNRLKVEIALGFILAGFFNISVMVPAISSNRGVLIICLILAGFFLSWCSAMAFAYLTQCFPTDVMGRVGGLTEGFGMLGAPLGVVVGSISLNITGRYSIAIAIIFIQCLLSFVLTFFLKKPKVFADKGPLGLM
jgi:MFS family permease